MDESSLSGFFEGFDFGETQETGGGNRLYLNGNNSFIRSLGRIQNEEAAGTIVQVIYIQALLAGRYTLDAKKMELMNKSLQKLMEYAIMGGSDWGE